MKLKEFILLFSDVNNILLAYGLTRRECKDGTDHFYSIRNVM
jgi:hypothetical protein